MAQLSRKTNNAGSAQPWISGGGPRQQYGHGPGETEELKVPEEDQPDGRRDMMRRPSNPPSVFSRILVLGGGVGYWIGLHLIADEWSRDSTMILAEETVNHCHDKESPLVVEHRQLSRHSLVATASQLTLATGGERNNSIRAQSVNP